MNVKIIEYKQNYIVFEINSSLSCYKLSTVNNHYELWLSTFKYIDSYTGKNIHEAFGKAIKILWLTGENHG